MKFGFIVPVLTDTNIEKTVSTITESFENEKEDSFEIIFALSGKLNGLFTKLRKNFKETENVKAFMVDRIIDEHKLITLGMEYCEGYDATIIYSGKEPVNKDVVNAFINSWKAGNKLVYLKKDLYGFSKIFKKLERGIYNMGVSMLGIFKDIGGETDIQLLDQDVVKTINQLPTKNRQLRVLDSFVGYNMDTIQLEVDPKQVVNKIYADKTKDYYISKTLSISFLCLSLINFLLMIILPFCKINFKIMAVIICLISFVVFIILSLIFNTKMQLNSRAGKLVSFDEIKEIRNKIECYNLNKLTKID